jgi:hypothetical protein
MVSGVEITMLRLVTSPSAAARLDAAAEFLARRSPASEAIIVGASRGAADDLARVVSSRVGASFGLTRFSLTELAARMAATLPSAEGSGATKAPSSAIGAEAAAARAVFDAMALGELVYFTPVARTPGFSRALARTLHELRLAGVDSADLDGIRAGHERSRASTSDLARLLARVERQLERDGVADRAAIFRLAAQAAAAGGRWVGLPIVLLDVPLDARTEREFALAILTRAPEAIITIPADDASTRAALAVLEVPIESLGDPASAGGDLFQLRRYLFTSEHPPVRERTGEVRLFSAPGEGREVVEIVRRVLDEAACGTRFDEMAVLLRAPQQYLGLLEHACARGQVPAYFDRGTRRPDPAGRAFIALVSCAAEGLSAKRFDEYLSLGQVPQLRVTSVPATPRAEEFAAWPALSAEEPDAEAPSVGDPSPDSDDEAVIAGTLRAPWKWEELIVESAVVGGRTLAEGKERWRRRLDGLAAAYRYRIAELLREEPDSPRVKRLARDLRNLAHLRQFALPIVDMLADWTGDASWGVWIDRFTTLASAALRRPTRVLALLAELRPMSAVGPVTLPEARDVLCERLAVLDWEPPAYRYGRLFVGTPHQARGRRFRVVFVPGLAERIVPQRPREDPLLLDRGREAIDPGLVRQEDRSRTERLLLKLAIGAADERLYLSYPRLDAAETRARVPSFYALDVVRALTGRIPDHRALAVEAAEEAGASLAWPAPANAETAIDDLEHDLASLKPLLETRDPASVKGHAHYLLGLNDALRRSVISRWARGRSAWSDADGLIRATQPVAAALAGHRLSRRPYSLSALQRFSVCPYQFLLASVMRLEPWEEPEPLIRVDPLTRGSLFHEVQTRFYRERHAAGALPITPSTLSAAAAVLEHVLQEVADEYAERLVPAIDRVWADEVEDIRRDLGIWLQKLTEPGEWVPEYFEFGFGLPLEGRDPRSLRDPIEIDGGYILHGSVDLIERHATVDALRVTDHKTGKNRASRDLIVGGGAVLQPVLYSVAIERGLRKSVVKGRLYYCTTAGGFASHEISIDAYARSQGLQALAIVDRAIEEPFLAAAPDERACTWCDFRPVCGPREEARVKHKARSRLADVEALRGLR